MEDPFERDSSETERSEKHAPVHTLTHRMRRASICEPELDIRSERKVAERAGSASLTDLGAVDVPETAPSPEVPKAGVSGFIQVERSTQLEEEPCSRTSTSSASVVSQTSTASLTRLRTATGCEPADPDVSMAKEKQFLPLSDLPKGGAGHAAEANLPVPTQTSPPQEVEVEAHTVPNGHSIQPKHSRTGSPQRQYLAQDVRERRPIAAKTSSPKEVAHTPLQIEGLETTHSLLGQPGSGTREMQGSSYPERLQVMIDTYNHLQSSMMTSASQMEGNSLASATHSQPGPVRPAVHHYCQPIGRATVDLADQDCGVHIQPHRGAPASAIVRQCNHSSLEKEGLERDITSLLLLLMLREYPRHTPALQGGTLVPRWVDSAPGLHLQQPAVPAQAPPWKGKAPFDLCTGRPAPALRELNGGKWCQTTLSDFSARMESVDVSLCEGSYAHIQPYDGKGTVDTGIFAEPGSLQRAILEQLTKYVLQHYSGGTPKAQWGSAARCRILLIDLLHCLTICLQRQGDKKLQTAAYIVQYVGSPSLLALTQAILHCLPFEAVPSSAIAGAEVLPGGLYASRRPTDTKGFQLYRMEYWLTTSHIVETCLAISQAMHTLESLVAFDYSAFEGPPAPHSSRANPQSPPHLLNFSTAHGLHVEDEAVDAESLLFQLVVLPSSASLGTQWLQPTAATDVSGVVPVKLGNLLEELGICYFDHFGSHVSVDAVDAALRDTLNEVFADPVVRGTVVEEVMRKLKPRPSYVQAHCV
eukprot:GGOE01004000.1.p1 GENE.GGOE01004000.1~~GGOE01004000.1.p1  ORF type:complete len:881 (-),score=92.28 GGOE01004000.1:118-2388(-)